MPRMTEVKKGGGGGLCSWQRLACSYWWWWTRIIIVFIIFLSTSCIPVVHKASTREELLETLKGRYNYASFDCAARVLATNKGSKSSSSVLQSQKDSYLLNLCSYNDKHIILELCQDIRIDTLVLANFEYFSSMVKDFTISVSKKYPPQGPNGWRKVGKFLAENSRREQVFPVNGTSMYSRYVRIDFETHHGNEYYCLLSVIRVYGKTMMEDFEESSSSIGGLPGARDGHQSSPTMTTVEATLVSSLPIDNEKVRATGRIQSQSSRIDSASTEISPTTEALSIHLQDLMEIFRQQSNFCQATTLPSSSSSLNTSDESGNGSNSNNILNEEESGRSPVPQENIFKAIHDRLHQLERNVTQSARSLEGELERLAKELKYVQEEIGITELTNEKILGEVQAVDGIEKLRSFRNRLVHHLERQNSQYLQKISHQIQVTLSTVEKDERLVFWIAIFGILQVTALIGIVTLGFALGWFRPEKSLPKTSQIQSLSKNSHRRSESEMGGGVPSAQRSRVIMDEIEQRVPDSGIINKAYREVSPAKSDLIMTASRPLLLDESEAELIEATFTGSPLSSREDNIDMVLLPPNPSPKVIISPNPKLNNGKFSVDFDLTEKSISNSPVQFGESLDFSPHSSVTSSDGGEGERGGGGRRRRRGKDHPPSSQPDTPLPTFI